jgi:hypothetical protein
MNRSSPSYIQSLKGKKEGGAVAVHFKQREGRVLEWSMCQFGVVSKEFGLIGVDMVM